ncbi:hypothetical protein [Microbulbifer sp. S227A]
MKRYHAQSGGCAARVIGLGWAINRAEAGTPSAMIDPGGKMDRFF